MKLGLLKYAFLISLLPSLAFAQLVKKDATMRRVIGTLEDIKIRTGN